MGTWPLQSSYSTAENNSAEKLSVQDILEDMEANLLSCQEHKQLAVWNFYVSQFDS